MSTGYATSTTAEENRNVKARAVEHWCWERAITPDDLQAATDAQRREIWRQALGTRHGSRVSTLTLNRVCARLRDRAAWVAEHPDDERARQPYAGLRHTWITREDTPR